MQLILKIIAGPFDDVESADVSRLLNWIRPGQSLTVGRTYDAEMVVRVDKGMSAVHFEVVCEHDGCLVRDLKSRHGIQLNGEQVGQAIIHDGDQIVAGQTTFQVGILDLPEHDDAQQQDENAPEPPSAIEPVKELAPPAPVEPVVEQESAESTLPESTPAAEPMQVVVTIVAGPFGDPYEANLSRLLTWIGAGQTLRVGRSPFEADMIVRDDPNMSGCHFELTCDGQRCQLTDLDSTNGTLIDGNRVSQTIVRHGDKIQAGDTFFHVGIMGGEDLSDEQVSKASIFLPEPLLPIESKPPRARPQFRSGSDFDPQDAQQQIAPNAEQFKRRVAAGERFDGVLLSNLDLAGVDLSAATLLRCMFVDTNLAGAKLVDADLQDCMFVQCDLSGADFTNADLRGTTWSAVAAPDAIFADAFFDDATMTASRALVDNPDDVETTFEQANVPSAAMPHLETSGMHGYKQVPCDFSGANLKRADFSGATLMSVVFRDANLSGVRWTRARIDNCLLDGADCDKSLFEQTTLIKGSLQAKFEGALFDHAQFDETEFRDVDLSGTELRGTRFSKLDLASHPTFPAALPGCMFVQCNLQGRDFTDRDLSHCDFSSSQMDQIKFQGSMLKGAEFRECDLSGFDFSGLDLTGADFSSANLAGADLSNTNLASVNFTQANLSRAKLDGAHLNNTNLVAADLSGGSLKNATIERSDFKKCNLAGAVIHDCELRTCDLSNLDLTIAEFQSVAMQTCRLVETRFTKMDLSEFTLEQCDFTSADMSEAKLDNTNLLQAKFNSADLTSASLKKCNATAAQFIAATLVDSDFDESDLTNVNLEDARAGQAKFNNARLESSLLGGADLTAAEFQKAQLQNANLSKANLTRANFGEANVEQADLHEAIEAETNWSGANRNKARDTNKELAAAEQWTPPEPEEKLTPIGS